MTVQRKITFEAGASFGQEDNAGIDDKGNAGLLTLVVRELLRSPKFVDGLFGEGWRLWMEDALSHLRSQRARLTVRQVMVSIGAAYREGTQRRRRALCQCRQRENKDRCS